MNKNLAFNNTFALLGPAFSTATSATAIENPQWVIRNTTLASQLNLELHTAEDNQYLKPFSGNGVIEGSEPVAMVYSGHQFGHYVNQLGDGRGLLLGEIETPTGKWDIHLKGAGPTAYSRMGDGRAVLRSCIREYLGSEALHALGVPTTRALCITTGDETVWRETKEHAAMLLRVARSHIRFGSFEFFHYNKQIEQVKQLADYCIDQYFPDIVETCDSNCYASFLTHVVKRTATMIAHWQSIGFAHGVMNTDNMSILGDTFDFGPYGFLDDYEEGFICNHSDPSGRYAFNAQPSVALWNLNALARSLSSLINEREIKTALESYQYELLNYYSGFMRAKLGLEEKQDNDQSLCNELLQLMQASSADFSNTFRALGTVQVEDKSHPLRNHFIDRKQFDAWLCKYQQRLKSEHRSVTDRHQLMNQINPKYILRNYLAQQAIEQAENGDFSGLEKLVKLLSRPHDEQPEFESYAKSPPSWGKRISVSCSS